MQNRSVEHINQYQDPTVNTGRMQYGLDHLSSKFVKRDMRNENDIYGSKTKMISEADTSLRMQEATTDAGD